MRISRKTKNGMSIFSAEDNLFGLNKKNWPSNDSWTSIIKCENTRKTGICTYVYSQGDDNTSLVEYIANSNKETEKRKCVSKI